jgi:hypothetical protein
LRESEDAWFPSCLPLWLSEEGREKTLVERTNSCWMSSGVRQKEYFELPLSENRS